MGVSSGSLGDSEEEIIIVVKRDVTDTTVVPDQGSLVIRMDPGDRTHREEDLDERRVQHIHHAQTDLIDPTPVADLARISEFVAPLLRELNARTIERGESTPVRDLEAEIRVDEATLLEYRVTSTSRVFVRMGRTVNSIMM